MYRFLFILGLLIYFFSSCNELTANSKKRVKTFENVTAQSKADTTCFDEFRLKEKGFSILKVCNVFFDDSLNKKFHLDHSLNRVSKEYNVDNYGRAMYYTMDHDTIILRILTLIENRNYRIVPDTFFMKRDTLFIKNKGMQVSNERNLQGIEWQEVNYKLFVTKRFDPVIIRLR
jgi:hypothetical protein